MCYAHRYQAWDVIDYKGDNAFNMRVTKRTTYRISLFQRIWFEFLSGQRKKCLPNESWPVEFDKVRQTNTYSVGPSREWFCVLLVYSAIVL